MAHDTARVSPRLHQTHENWEASHDFPRFSDGPPASLTQCLSTCPYTVTFLELMTYSLHLTEWFGNLISAVLRERQYY